jgi:hypothetical protein
MDALEQAVTRKGLELRLRLLVAVTLREPLLLPQALREAVGLGVPELEEHTEALPEAVALEVGEALMLRVVVPAELAVPQGHTVAEPELLPLGLLLLQALLLAEAEGLPPAMVAERETEAQPELDTEPQELSVLLGDTVPHTEMGGLRL